MSYTTDRTWVTGEIPTGSTFNTYVRDNLKWLSTDAPCCRIKDSGTFSHNSSGNSLAVTHNQEDFDNATMHDTSSNTDRMTIPTGGGGKYILGGYFFWDSNATGIRACQAWKNGVAGTRAGDHGLPASAAAIFAQGVHGWHSFAAADYAVLAGYQTSGGTRTITQGGAWAVWQRI